MDPPLDCMRFSVLLTLLVASAAHSQPLTLDMELAEVALGVERAEDVRAGTMPEPLRAFLPEGATVVGSIARGTPDDSGVGFLPPARGLSFARVDATPEAAALAFADRSFPGRRHRESFLEQPESGFTRSREPSSYFTLYPEDGQGTVVTVQFSERSRGGAYVRISERDLAPFETMQRGRERRDPEVARDALKSSLPLLQPPAGAVQSPTGGGGSEDYQTQKALLTSGLSVAEILAHYGALMEAGGWTQFGKTTADAHGTSGWAMVQDGQHLAALFQVSRRDGREHVLSILVSNGDED